MSDTTRFRAIVFDLFGTLAPALPAPEYARSLIDMAEAVGVDAPAFVRLWKDTRDARTTGRLSSIEANVQAVCETVGVCPTQAQLAEAARIRAEACRRFLVPRQDTVPTLWAIRAAGLGIGLVSDCSVEVPQVWPELPYAALVDVPVFSCQTGTQKPDPRMYRLAADGLGVSPQDCVYVGDGFSRELSGASSAGMHAILLYPPGETQSEMFESERSAWTGACIAALSELLDILELNIKDPT
jgi:putative hydrolase of the HAD superfamily